MIEKKGSKHVISLFVESMYKMTMAQLRHSYAFLCRDCFSSGYLGAEKPPVSCPKCSSSDVRVNDDIFQLSIAHLDCDSFYASVEKRDNPELAHKPVMVGGENRGVVAAACYIARQYGVKSAMPTFQAKRLCPDITIIKPRMDHYVSVSQKIRQMMLELTPLIEPLSIDEAFLDLSGTEILHKASPAESLMRLQKKIKEEVGITVSIGLAATKSLAKLSSDQDKPDGFFILNEAEAEMWLHDKPVSILYGVGKSAAKRLSDAGITSCGALKQADKALVTALLGKQAGFIQNLARGIDTRPVKTERQAKSVSSETTFHKDLNKSNEMSPIIERQSQLVSRRLKKKGLEGNVITLKLKTNHHKIITRSKTLSAPTDKAHEISAIANQLLMKELSDDRYWRLLGVGVDGFEHGALSQNFLDQIDGQKERRDKLEQAIDKMHDKFGGDVVFSGRQVDRLRPKS